MPDDVNNVISKKRQDTAKRIIAALKQQRGLTTLAAKAAGVNYVTVTRYLNEFPSVRKAADEAKEGLLDYVESKLLDNISKGDTIAQIFFLKTQGKGRGYSEAPLINIDNRTQTVYMTDEELIEIINRGSGKRISIEAASAEKPLTIL